MSNEQELTFSFDCCSRYRQCSDARRCIHPDVMYSRNCTYRTKIEQGIIFYGKNANSFDREMYDRLISEREKMDLDTRKSFDSLLDEFYSKHSGIAVKMNYEPAYEQFGAYFTIDRSPEKLLDRYPIAFLRDEVRKIGDTFKARKKSEIIRHIADKLPELCAELCRDICYVSTDEKTYTHLLEVYLDTREKAV